MSDFSKSGIRDGYLYIFGDYRWLHAIFVIIAGPLLIFMSFFHIHKSIKNVKHSKSQKNNKSDCKFTIPIHFLVTTSLIMCGVDLVFSIINYFHINIFECAFLTDIIVLSWGYIKNCVYFLGILRILYAYRSSTFQYSNRFIRFVIIITISLATLNLPALIYGEGIKLYNDEHNYYWCQYRYKLNWRFFVPLLFDSIINTVLLVLFLKPLMGLTQAHTQNKSYNISAFSVFE